MTESLCLHTRQLLMTNNWLTSWGWGEWRSRREWRQGGYPNRRWRRRRVSLWAPWVGSTSPPPLYTGCSLGRICWTAVRKKQISYHITSWQPRAARVVTSSHLLSSVSLPSKTSKPVSTSPTDCWCNGNRFHICHCCWATKNADVCGERRLQPWLALLTL